MMCVLDCTLYSMCFILLYVHVVCFNRVDLYEMGVACILQYFSENNTL